MIAVSHVMQNPIRFERNLNISSQKVASLFWRMPKYFILKIILFLNAVSHCLVLK